MRIKITRPDGTIVEAEGTVEECERITSAPLHVRDLPLPVVAPYVQPAIAPYHIEPWPTVQPWEPVITWRSAPTTTTDRFTFTTTTIGAVS